MNAITTSLKHDVNGDEIITFTYKNITIDKLFESELFYLQSVSNSIATILGKSSMNVMRFVNSYNFYNQLCLLDSSLERYGNIYLKYGDIPKTVKVGRSFEITRRYNEEEQKLLIDLVPVRYDSKVEKNLIKTFNKVFRKVEGTNETFYYSNIKDAKDLFTSFVLSLPEQYKADLDYKKSSHIQNFFVSLHV